MLCVFTVCMYVCMYVCISVMIPTARIYPSLAFNVDEASWNMTKSMMMFKKAVDGLHTEDFEKFRVEEFIRTGTDTIKLLCKLNECNKQDYLIGKVMDIPVEDSAEKSVAPLSQESPVKVMITTHYYALLNALNFPILEDRCALFGWSGFHLAWYIHALWNLELWVTAAYGLADRTWHPDPL